MLNILRFIYSHPTCCGWLHPSWWFWLQILYWKWRFSIKAELT